MSTHKIYALVDEKTGELINIIVYDPNEEYRLPKNQKLIFIEERENT